MLTETWERALRPYARRGGDSDWTPDRSALLVVDMQRFFLDSDSPVFLPAGKTALPVVRTLIRGARQAGRPVAYSLHANVKTTRKTPMTRWWHRLCPPTSRWAGLGEGLEAAPGEWAFRKSRYSAFRGTRLNMWLKKRGVTNLVIAGVMTHLCVEATVRDAFEAGYRVTVPLDGCAAGEEVLHLGSLRSMACGFAHVRRGRDIDFSTTRRMK